MKKPLRVIASSLNLRTGPGTSYSSLKTIPTGATLTPIDTGPWMLVRVGGAVGWVHKNFVEEITVAAKPAWRVARSLETLIAQVNDHAPARNRAYDGTIGDLAHASRKSDHNPNLAGVVTARDITDDPSRGCAALHIAESIRLSKDRRVAYVIHAGRIFSSSKQAWSWRPYAGADPHTHHVHISVVEDASLYDDPQPWQLLWPPPAH